MDKDLGFNLMSTFLFFCGIEAYVCIINTLILNDSGKNTGFLSLSNVYTLPVFSKVKKAEVNNSL